jgi:hypothetical protein
MNNTVLWTQAASLAVASHVLAAVNVSGGWGHLYNAKPYQGLDAFSDDGNMLDRELCKWVDENRPEEFNNTVFIVFPNSVPDEVFTHAVIPIVELGTAEFLGKRLYQEELDAAEIFHVGAGNDEAATFAYLEEVANLRATYAQELADLNAPAWLLSLAQEAEELATYRLGYHRMVASLNPPRN